MAYTYQPKLLSLDLQLKGLPALPPATFYFVELTLLLIVSNYSLNGTSDVRAVKTSRASYSSTFVGNGEICGNTLATVQVWRELVNRSDLRTAETQYLTRYPNDDLHNPMS
ncbi:hypothetical protein AB3R30_24290 [Leptolyngbyaceae cyanobacterium UHCC 1019]